MTERTSYELASSCSSLRCFFRGKAVRSSPLLLWKGIGCGSCGILGCVWYWYILHRCAVHTRGSFVSCWLILAIPICLPCCVNSIPTPTPNSNPQADLSRYEISSTLAVLHGKVRQWRLASSLEEVRRALNDLPPVVRRAVVVRQNGAGGRGTTVKVSTVGGVSLCCAVLCCAVL